jgi:pimeloyl-ACP methyl ester carboxylesterase
MVQWDERGAGFSYREGMDPATISEGQIASDALQLIAYLLKTFHKEKLYLVGQSFGSALGIHLAATHPELFCAYVGMGQVIHYDRSVEITYAWLHGVLEKAGDAESLKKIEKDHFPSIDLVTRYGGHHRLSLDLGAVMRASPYYYDGYAEVLQKGKTFSQECVARNPSAFTAPWTITELKVPVYFFEGVYDHVIACAPELVAEFADKVRAPAKELIWFRDSAHLVNLEEPGKFQDELIRIREKTYYSSSRTVSRRPAGEG